MEEVRQFVWYIEARNYVAPPGYAPADPQSMGSAVAVELETQMPDGTWVARKYLLTCGHVVRKATAKNGDGWGPRLMEVCCFRPEKPYLRTGEGERRSNVHRGAYLADVHAFSPYSTLINESVPEPGRLSPHDWVLLDVKDEHFQLLPAVKVWAVGKPGMKLGLVGYPGGAGTAKKPVWKDFQDIVTSPSPREFILELTDLGMLKLSGAETREGMSGGGYFSAADGALLGIHRSSRDEALARFGISIEHIRDELEKKRMRPVTRATGPKAQAHPSADLVPPTPYLTKEQEAESVGIVWNAFKNGGLGELLRFKLGMDLETNSVRKGNLSKELVFKLFNALREDCLMSVFLDAVIDARPDNAEVQQKFPLLRESLTGGPQTSAEAAETVIRSIHGIVRSLPIEEVRREVSKSEGSLQRLVDAISLLRTYKSLHDNLHYLQMTFPRFEVALRNFGSASAELEECLDDLQTHSVSIRDTITQLPPTPSAIRRVETEWLTLLAAIADLAQQAINNSNPILARQSFLRLRGLLVREPSRIDGILKMTAEDLDLAELKRLFTDVAMQPAVAATVVLSLQEGRIASEHLLRKIKVLVNRHSQWQNIDRNLWEADERLQKSAASDISDFDALWAGTKEDLAVMTDTHPTAEWAKSLNLVRDTLDSQRTVGDWKAINTNFRRFRKAARLEFFNVDSGLNTMAGEVTRIGGSLQSLLNSL